jgi:acyl-CoA thioesterase FadM
MRWIRLLLALIKARFKSKLSVDDTSKIRFSVWITDVDATIMNHAALMTVMEAGRLDLMVRSGFFTLARKNKWYVPSSAVSVQFLRPLKIFQKASLTTRVFHVTEKWIYIEHKVTRGEKEIAFCIVKSTVKKGREVLDVQEIIKQLGNNVMPAENPGLIALYENQSEFMKQHFTSHKT